LHGPIGVGETKTGVVPIKWLKIENVVGIGDVQPVTTVVDLEKSEKVPKTVESERDVF
jgi:hypothetical protein